MKLSVRHSLFFLCTFTFSTFYSFAQEQAPKVRKWKIGNIGLYIGGHGDKYQKMDLQQMKSYASSQKELMEVDLDGYEGDFYNKVSGAVLAVNLSLTPYSFKNRAYKNNQSLRIGTNVHLGREGMISYQSNLDFSLDPGESNHTITYCLIENEISANADYIFTGNLSKKIYVYSGFGTQISGTFGNQFLMLFDRQTANPDPELGIDYTSDMVEYDAKETIYGRAYIPYGVGCHLGKRINLVFDGRIGMGFQNIIGGKTHLIKKTGAGMLGVNYCFK